VSIEAAKWQHALEQLGFSTITVAGSGPVDQLIPGLSIGAASPPTAEEMDAALAPADLVVVENLCSLPLNPAAASVVARTIAGRPSVVHHHDLPWQRPQFLDHPPPPVDPRWRHVTINELSRKELATRGIDASTVYNTFAVAPPVDDEDGNASAMSRSDVRHSLGVADDELVVLQPTRAIPRKNVPGGIRLAAELGACYWLLGPAEDGYGPELNRVIDEATCRVILGTPAGIDPTDMDAAYGACDVVALPSTWEGFGNPTIESVVHRKPLAIGPYPVADELAAFGFDWFALSEMDRLASWLVTRDPALLEANLSVAAAHFSVEDLPGRIEAVLPDL
jgi:glycosyltransferase involved in cell wall biosynthesis